MNRINRHITDNYIRKIKASKKASKDAKEMTDIDYERISVFYSYLHIFL